MNEATARTFGAAGPGVITAIGLAIPVAPVAIGVFACLLVRVPLFKWKTWVADLCLTGLSVLGTTVTIIDHNISPGSAFWCGIGFGAMGSTLIEVGKSAMAGALKERFQAAGRIFFGIKGDPPTS